MSRWASGKRNPANSALVLLSLRQLGRQPAPGAPVPETEPALAKDFEFPPCPPMLVVSAREELERACEAEKVKEALRKSAEAFRGLDTERIKREIYKARG